jgi:DNA-directed RNA polymerase subunit RPC12/RpoP
MACPKCGSEQVAAEPTMREASDATGALVYYRCGRCRLIFSRITIREHVDDGHGRTGNAV